MVNKTLIIKELKRLAKVSGSVSVDDQGLISCTGDVIYKDTSYVPLKFDRVMGDFDCSFSDMDSLLGVPTYVGGNFYCSQNRLKSLHHSPKHVGASFICCGNAIIDLTGAPDFVGSVFHLPYTPAQNLLRLCTYNSVLWCKGNVPEPVEQIIKKYLGQGKAGAIKAAAELIKAGYPQHAKW